MLLGFISLLLTVAGNLISKICIPESVANTWHPCDKEREAKLDNEKETTEQETTEHENRRRLLEAVAASGGSIRRALAAGSATDKCSKVCFDQYISINNILSSINRQMRLICCVNSP